MRQSAFHQLLRIPTCPWRAKDDRGTIQYIKCSLTCCTPRVFYYTNRDCKPVLSVQLKILTFLNCSPGSIVGSPNTRTHAACTGSSILGSSAFAGVCETFVSSPIAAYVSFRHMFAPLCTEKPLWYIGSLVRFFPLSLSLLFPHKGWGMLVVLFTAPTVLIAL